MKSIKELSLPISEPEYRKLGGFSYSMLSKFQREGDPKSLIDTTKQDSESLRFGSLVDCLLTEPDTFKDRFIVTSIKSPPQTIIYILQYIIESQETPPIYSKIPEELKIEALNRFDYGTTWLISTRIKRLDEHAPYYNLLRKSSNKTLVTKEEYDLAINCIYILKNHPFTHKYMDDEEAFEDNIEKIYQLKFSSIYEGNLIMCMFDKLIVDHKSKTIQHIDLKTSSKKEEDFFKSALDWNYYLQATMYSQILLDNILKDSYFKDFKILPFKFIVINKFSKSPLVWKYPLNIIDGLVIDPQEELLQTHGYKNWKQLLSEASWHLNNEKFEYSYFSYLNNGEQEINFSKLLH